MSEKDELRVWARQIAHELSERRKAESNLAAMQALLSLEAFKTAETVFCYVSVRDEVSTRAILEAALKLGKTVCVPRCLPGNTMEAVAIGALSDLEPGLFGIPSAGKGGLILPASMIDITVLPCLCADEKGHRIGYGKGYYDRFLAGYQGLSVVLCRKELLVENIPAEFHDQKADLVIAA